MKQKIFTAFLQAVVILGGALLLFSLIPGNFSPLSVLKKGADLLVADGDFEALTLEFWLELF